eukprot:1141212-Pelagomonas_calceolata.AAC.4
MPPLTSVAHWEPYPQRLSSILPPFWISKEISNLLPRHSWSLQIIAVWNTAARIRLNENNLIWLADLARDILEARWWKAAISNYPVLDAKHPDI